jgi:asparagine synthase (glutamine-hydrolysing)
MTALMRRRGPDAEGFWTDDRHVALGFRRLAILDLSPAGNQPMESACGRYVIVFNGEVYNFPEIRRELEQRGRRFRSTCDTEVVLLALAEWGQAALSRFNGMFALAWYDRDAQELLLARDPMGIKPLYYMWSPRGLVFGSQYDQLVRHPWLQRRLNPEILGLYLRLGYIPPPYALFEGTQLLPPGQALTVKAGSDPRTFAYYRFPAETAELSTEEDAAELTDAAVGNAVRRQMVSDVPLGAFLSGGVDSPLVAAHMRRVSSEVRAFTIGCTDPEYDESPVARAYAGALELENAVDSFGPEECLSLVQEGALAYSEPFADFSSLPSLLLCRSTRRHVTVALSGDGGDELFWGYPRFWKIANNAGWFKRPRAVRAAAYLLSRGRKGALPRGLLFRSPGEWQFDGHCFSGLRPADLRLLCPEARTLPHDFRLYDYDRAASHESLARWLRRNEIDGHLQMVLLKMDRASMHYSLEVRVPLLDLEVVSAAARIAPGACMRGGTGKIPLRRALARRVPPETIPQRKAGFTIPLGDWLNTELRGLVEDLLLDGDPYPQGLFDRAALGRIYREHQEGRDRTRSLWHLLSLQLWARQHLRPPFSLDPRPNGHCPTPNGRRSTPEAQPPAPSAQPGSLSCA